MKLLLAALLLVLASPSRAIRPTDDNAKDAKRFGLNRLEDKRPKADREKALKAVEDYNRGGRRRGLGLSAAGASAPAAARAVSQGFLEAAASELGLDPSELAIDRENAGQGNRNLLYRQTWRGLPVEFSRVKVHLAEDGSVLGVHSNFQKDIALDPSPRLSASAAEQAAVQDAGAGARASGEAALVVYPSREDGRAYLAWKISVRAPGGLWRYYVDARDGTILFRYNDLRYQAVCLTSGVVTAEVYDIDPASTPGPTQRRLNHLKVYVMDGSTYALTGGDTMLGQGFYCSGTKGKVFSQLQGPWVNVSNFRGPSAHYDNGTGVWSTVGTPLSSPHPYPVSATIISTINISGLAPTAVKFMPVFSAFQVGQIAGGDFGTGGDISDNDQLAIIDSADNPVASYIGNRGAFRGAAVPGQLMRLRLRSNAAVPNIGFDVSLSSWLALTNPSDWGPTGDINWTPALSPSGLRSEINLFYHLNRMRDYFISDVNKSSAANLSRPVNAMALAGPNFVNAFYDPENDNLFFGDVSDAFPADTFTDDATVPRHEYTHFVVEKLWPIQNFGQGGAISEAVADFFSAASLDFPRIGLHVVTAFGGTGALRELDCAVNGTCKVLGGNYNWAGEIHDDSNVISQALWEIRKDRIAAQGAAAGKSCADGLVFQSLLFFPDSIDELLDAMLKVDAIGGVPACGAGVCGGIAAGCVQSVINARFAAHGLILSGSTADPYDNAGFRNDGFQTAVDLSTISSVTGTILPAGDLDFFTFGAGPGRIEIELDLPPSGPFYKGYAMILYDKQHRPVAHASPPYDGFNTTGGFCDNGDCNTTASKVKLIHQNGEGGQFYLQVAGGETFAGASNSGVNSTVPYSFKVNIPPRAAHAASVVSASFDRDRLRFQVGVSSFAFAQVYKFSYAQLRDQAFAPIPNTRTQVPAQPADFLVMLSSQNQGGYLIGELQLQAGFAGRFPSVGTVYLEVFGYNVFGSTVSLGLSQALNLAADKTALTAFNNVFNPNRGEKTTIKYEIQTPGRVTLKLYTLNGNFVATIFDDDVAAGKGSVDWQGKNYTGSVVASGVYLLRMTGPGGTLTQKVAVVK